MKQKSNFQSYIDRIIYDFENWYEYNDSQRKPIIELLARANLYDYYVNLRCRDSEREYDPIDEYIEKWMNECLIGSEPVVDSLKNKRILGALRQKVEGDKDLIPLRGVSLYKVQIEDEFIQPLEKLQILKPLWKQRRMR